MESVPTPLLQKVHLHTLLASKNEEKQGEWTDSLLKTRDAEP